MFCHRNNCWKIYRNPHSLWGSQVTLGTRIAEADNINGTTASIKGILVDTNGHLAANEGEVDKLEGLVSFANAINVTSDTTSLTMSFNLGEGMSLNPGGC